MGACSECGASLPEGADRCDLCGTPAQTVDSAAMACAQCGHQPPAGSQFCNSCGAALDPAAASAPSRPPEEAPAPRPSSDPGKRALAVAGLGLGAVVLLYGATLLAGSDAPEPAAEPASGAAAEVGEAAPIPEGTPPLPDSLQRAADAFAAEGTAEGWYEAGRYYLTAAFQATQTDPTSSVQWARRAIRDFEQSLALAEDPRVRVALAEAATFDPQDPMRPVQELRAVLDADPGNMDATVLLAERRLMIGRVDSARVGFEKVLAEAPPGSMARQRAERGMEALGQP